MGPVDLLAAAVLLILLLGALGCAAWGARQRQQTLPGLAAIVAVGLAMTASHALSPGNVPLFVVAVLAAGIAAAWGAGKRPRAGVFVAGAVAGLAVAALLLPWLELRLRGPAASLVLLLAGTCGGLLLLQAEKALLAAATALAGAWLACLALVHLMRLRTRVTWDSLAWAAALVAGELWWLVPLLAVAACLWQRRGGAPRKG